MLGRTLYVFDSFLTCGLVTIKKGVHTYDLTIPKLPLTQGVYTLDFVIGGQSGMIDYIYGGMKFNVIDDDYFGTGRMVTDNLKGKVMLCEHQWSVDD